MVKSVKLICVGLVGIISGCASFWGVEQGTSENQGEALAKLVSYELNDGYIEITAMSNGCTFVNSFEVQVNELGENQLKVVRVKPDLCRMKQRKVALQYSYKHLGLNFKEDITVVNDVVR